MTKIVIDRFGSLVRASCEAPNGNIWRASGTHEVVSEARGGKDATAYVRKDLNERIALGYEPCEDTECDWCNGKDAENFMRKVSQ
jgi:hypothetical protein